ncbi:hypothetical protein T4D_14153 [Trichinella pseudospiralis]|uniref:Uncharacterized protein n=1 Tax=Trichinella pseudospiralis TaxID=6337 RepID=A0A0V1FM33_TRIPS|nr:hypothetical protein T4D_14153 [Trichinella pseudospiralis]
MLRATEICTCISVCTVGIEYASATLDVFRIDDVTCKFDLQSRLRKQSPAIGKLNVWQLIH